MKFLDINYLLNKEVLYQSRMNDKDKEGWDESMRAEGEPLSKLKKLLNTWIFVDLQTLHVAWRGRLRR
jgi:hypothetical protein